MLPNNPLTQYFRQPAIYIRLPSQGRFYPPGTLNMPPNGELPVLPMTSVDEITYRTPDALFNGAATVSVIRSCVPAIRDPWVMPGVDVDAVLVAIRIASYGHAMAITPTCPECKELEDVMIDLRAVNDGIRIGNYEEPLSVGDLEVYFSPITYHTVNLNNQVQLEQQQKINALASQDLDDQARLEKLKEIMAAINELTIKTVAHSIGAIKSPSAMVTEHEFILDYLHNCDSKIFNQLKDHIIQQRELSEIKPLNLTCSSCKHQYKQPFTLDMASFFGSNS
jgi:hypothetical protein